jgi:hypothetical protein
MIKWSTFEDGRLCRCRSLRPGGSRKDLDKMGRVVGAEPHVHKPKLPFK